MITQQVTKCVLFESYFSNLQTFQIELPLHGSNRNVKIEGHLQMDEKSEPRPVTPEEISREIERFLEKVGYICSTSANNNPTLYIYLLSYYASHTY